MTDGILLMETQADPLLLAYDTIIVDEAHERNLNIDFLLGYLKTLLRKRADLKLIITSATIDTEKFASAFDNAPVIEVTGRVYPVEVLYRPIEQGDEDGEDVSLVEAAVRAVDELRTGQSDRGDILIFMPTEQDIGIPANSWKGGATTIWWSFPCLHAFPGPNRGVFFRLQTPRKLS